MAVSLLGVVHRGQVVEQEGRSVQVLDRHANVRDGLVRRRQAGSYGFGQNRPHALAARQRIRGDRPQGLVKVEVAFKQVRVLHTLAVAECIESV